MEIIELFALVRFLDMHMHGKTLHQKIQVGKSKQKQKNLIFSVNNVAC